MTPKDIDKHPLLRDDMRLVAKAMLKHCRETRMEFSLEDYAKVALRAAGRDYEFASENNDTTAMVLADRELRRAALLYVYEALRASENGLLVGTRPGTLKDITILAQEVL